jgi:hypothetical protein
MSKTEKLLSILKSECEYPKPLSVNAPLVAEIILVMRRLSAENSELRARLDAIYSTEPVAFGLFAKVEDGYFHLQHPVRFTEADAKSDRAMYEKSAVIRIRPLIPLPEKS